MGKDDMRTCPECGAKVARSILLCDCGYHFQTKRVLEKTDDGEPDDASLVAHGAALRADRGEVPPRIWLARSALVLRLLAGLGVLGTLAWSAMLLTAWVKTAAANPSSTASSSDATTTLVTLLCVLVGGIVNFILMMGLSEAATSLRELEHRAIALSAQRRS